MSFRTLLTALALAATTATTATAATAAAADDVARYRVVSVTGHRSIVNSGGELTTEVRHRFTLARPTVVEFGYLSDFSVDVRGRYWLSATMPELTCEKTAVFRGSQASVVGQWQGRNRLMLGFTVAADDDCGPFTSATVVPLGGGIDTVRLTRGDALRKTIRLTASVRDTTPLDDMTSTADMRVTVVLKAI